MNLKKTGVFKRRIRKDNPQRKAKRWLSHGWVSVFQRRGCCYSVSQLDLYQYGIYGTGLSLLCTSNHNQPGSKGQRAYFPATRICVSNTTSQVQGLYNPTCPSSCVREIQNRHDEPDNTAPQKLYAFFPLFSPELRPVILILPLLTALPSINLRASLTLGPKTH